MVTVQQLSIFLENKLGRLNEVMEIIGKSDIRIIAAMVADTSEYGILRLITSDTQKAFQVLKEHNISVNRCEVIALSTGASVGSFSQKLHPSRYDGGTLLELSHRSPAVCLLQGSASEYSPHPSFHWHLPPLP